MALLLNEYPAAFISKYFNLFFKLNNAVPILKQLDAQFYQELHKKRLHQPTRREKELQGMPTDIDKIPEELRKCKAWNPNIMYARYEFEAGPRLDFRKAFRLWWHNHFVQTKSCAADVAVKFAVKSNQTLE